MKSINHFNKKIINFDKPIIKVLMEDTKSGFDFYSKFLLKFNPNVEFTFIKMLDSDGNQVGGWSNLTRKMKTIDLCPNEKLLIIFDRVLLYHFRKKVYYEYNKLSKRFPKQVYYFSPLCFEELILYYFNDISPNKLISRLNDCLEDDKPYVKFNYNVDLNNFMCCDLSSDYVNKTPEKLISNYCSLVCNSNGITLNKSYYDGPIELNKCLFYLQSIINFIVTGEHVISKMNRPIICGGDS